MEKHKSRKSRLRIPRRQPGRGKKKSEKAERATATYISAETDKVQKNEIYIHQGFEVTRAKFRACNGIERGLVEIIKRGTGREMSVIVGGDAGGVFYRLARHRYHLDK